MFDNDIKYIEEQFNSIVNINEDHQNEFDRIITGIKERASQIKVLDASEDSNAFCEYVLVDRVSGKNYKQAQIHTIIQDAIKDNQYILIEISRYHGKTSQIIGAILHILGKNRNSIVKIVSSDDTMAGKRAFALRTHIERNKRLHEVFPNLKMVQGDWLKTRFTVERDIIDVNPTLEAAGILSTATGDRASLLVFDDPVDMRNAILQPTLREKVIEAFDNVWMNILDPGGKVIYIATPWHNSDLTAELKKRWADLDGAKIIKFKVGDDIAEDGTVIDTGDIYHSIWPEMWPKDALIQQRKKIGSRAYERGFLCKAMSDDEILFKESWLLNSIDKTWSFVNSYAGQEWEDEKDSKSNERDEDDGYVNPFDQFDIDKRKADQGDITILEDM